MIEGTIRSCSTAIRHVRNTWESMPAVVRRRINYSLARHNWSECDRALLQRVSTQISPHDVMYSSDRNTYFYTGTAGARCVEAAMIEAQLPSPSAILDLPCGYGRILRFLKLLYPEAVLTACDLDRGAVDFCRKHLGAEGLYSQNDFRTFSLNRTFDLICCFSLVTHLSSSLTLETLRFFHRHLRVGGLLVLTTLGPAVLKLRDQRQHLSITPELDEQIRASFQESGYGYADYVGQHNYGLAFISPEWMATNLPSTGDWQLSHYRENGWIGTQDVYGLVRKA